MAARYNLMLRQDSPQLRPFHALYSEPFGSVPHETVKSVLRWLGYERVARLEDRSDVWRLTATDTAAPLEMRQSVLIPGANYVLATGGAFYETSFVIDLFSYLSFGKISPEVALLILRAFLR